MRTLSTVPLSCSGAHKPLRVIAAAKEFLATAQRRLTPAVPLPWRLPATSSPHASLGCQERRDMAASALAASPGSAQKQN